MSGSPEPLAKTPIRCSRLIYWEGHPHWCDLPGNHPGPHQARIQTVIEFGP